MVLAVGMYGVLEFEYVCMTLKHPLVMILGCLFDVYLFVTGICVCLMKKRVVCLLAMS